jgi:hypothetical protein
MEGSSEEFHITNLLIEYKAGNFDIKELEQKFEFISHFSDLSGQDSTTKNVHMDVLIRDLEVKGRLWSIFLKKLMVVVNSIVAEQPSGYFQCFLPNSRAQLIQQLEHPDMAKMYWMA